MASKEPPGQPVQNIPDHSFHAANALNGSDLEEKGRRVLEKAERAVGKTVKKAEALVEDSARTLRSALQDDLARVGAYVSRNPWESFAIAFLSGMAVKTVCGKKQPAKEARHYPR